VKKSDVIEKILQHKLLQTPQRDQGQAFAPTNIALCKYWGKRDSELNLPVTSSLSIALPTKGALTSIIESHAKEDVVILNDKEVSPDSNFAKRLKNYLDLFRVKTLWRLQIDIKMNIPAAAGLASSACGFASLVSALNELFAWQLTKRELSLLARLGSGSAARSLWNGFVEWYAGTQADGMDSYAQPLAVEWPTLTIGILPISDAEKPVSSRVAMQRTVETSMLYANWPNKAAQDMKLLHQALQEKNFSLLGETAESNALNMHSTMLSSWPPVCYFLPETIAAMQQIWSLRRDGIEVYFTQDAGPNLKLLLHKKDKMIVKKYFPHADMINLF